MLPITSCTSVPFLKWSYKKRCTNAIVGVPIGGSWFSQQTSIRGRTAIIYRALAAQEISR